jgi:hypothetical protein
MRNCTAKTLSLYLLHVWNAEHWAVRRRTLVGRKGGDTWSYGFIILSELTQAMDDLARQLDLEA